MISGPAKSIHFLINGLGFVCTAPLGPHALGSLYSISDTLQQLVKIGLVHDLVSE